MRWMGGGAGLEGGDPSCLRGAGKAYQLVCKHNQLAFTEFKALETQRIWPQRKTNMPPNSSNHFLRSLIVRSRLHYNRDFIVPRHWLLQNINARLHAEGLVFGRAPDGPACLDVLYRMDNSI